MLIVRSLNLAELEFGATKTGPAAVVATALLYVGNNNSFLKKFEIAVF